MRTWSAIPALTVLFCLSSVNALTQKCGVPGDRIAFVPFDGQVFRLEGKHNAWRPTRQQVEAAECILKERLEDDAHRWSHPLHSALMIEDHSSTKGRVETFWHYRQYSGATNDRGDKLVCINAFCDPKANWRRDLVWVLDGGDCYWQAVIDLTSHTVDVFEVNGDA